MSEEELLKELDDTVNKLNTLLYKAAQSNIEVKLSQQHVNSFMNPNETIVTFRCSKDVTPPQRVTPTGGLSFLAITEQN